MTIQCQCHHVNTRTPTHSFLDALCMLRAASSTSGCHALVTACCICLSCCCALIYYVILVHGTHNHTAKGRGSRKAVHTQIHKLSEEGMVKLGFVWESTAAHRESICPSAPARAPWPGGWQRLRGGGDHKAVRTRLTQAMSSPGAGLPPPPSVSPPPGLPCGGLLLLPPVPGPRPTPASGGRRCCCCVLPALPWRDAETPPPPTPPPPPGAGAG